MTDPPTFDADVLIDYLRGLPEAGAYLDALIGPVVVSAVTLAELYAGVREGPERTVLDESAKEFVVVPVDAEIAVRAGLYRRNYRRSHNLALADVIVAATAAGRGSSRSTASTSPCSPT